MNDDLEHDFEDAHPFQRHVLPKEQAFQTVRATLAAELGDLKHLNCVLANIFYIQKKKIPYVYVAFGSSAYSRRSRYNALKLTYALVSTIKALATAGYVEIFLGFQGHNGFDGRRTRIAATPKLLSLLEKELEKPVNDLFETVKTECIELRDEDGAVEYVDSRFTRTARKLLDDYNTCIKQADIVFPDDALKTDTYRVFSGGWDKGGRFYNHRWSYLPKQQRLAITINGEAVVECDYSAQHLRLLYAMLGFQVANDPYAVRNYARDAVKHAILIMLNAKSQDGARKAIRLKLTRAAMALKEDAGNVKAQKFVAAFDGVDISDLIADITAYHEPIWNFFCSGIGIVLQNLDSRICEMVLKHFTALNVPCLPVHDSFIVPASYENELVKVMKAAAMEIGKVIDAPISVTGGVVELLKAA